VQCASKLLERDLSGAFLVDCVEHSVQLGSACWEFCKTTHDNDISSWCDVMSLSRCPTHISVCPSETISHLRSKIKSSSLIISRPLLPYGYIYKASCAGPDKKNPIPSKLNRHLYFLTSGHSDAQPWASECPDVKNYKWRLNPVWHRMLHMATVGVKGLSWLSWRYNALLGVKMQIYKQTANGNVSLLLLLQSSTLIHCFTHWVCTQYLNCFFLRLRFVRMSFCGSFVPLISHV